MLRQRKWSLIISFFHNKTRIKCGSLLFFTMNIILTGMPGCGKSTSGNAIAKELGLKYIDTDKRIEKKYKMPIPRIFKLVGEIGFRKLESEILQKIISTENKYVLATGGGLPCSHGNMDSLNDAGITFYIKVMPAILSQRIYNSKKIRPLTANMTKLEIEEYTQELLKVREIFYLKSKYIYTLSMGNITDFIRRKLEIKTHS